MIPTRVDVIEKDSVKIYRMATLDLKEKGMIKINETRPKKYTPIAPNLAFDNLISHLREENQKKITNLINKAKILETDLYESNLLTRKETSRVFWSTALGIYSIESLYLNSINELEEELLITAFINKKTVKRLPFLKRAFETIMNAIERGVDVKYLCMFEVNENPLLEQDSSNQRALYDDLAAKMKELYDMSSDMDGFEMKFTHKKIPTYYDLFDGKRVILKLQNPLNTADIFACLNVLDPKLAKELRKKYINIWTFDGIT